MDAHLTNLEELDVNNVGGGLYTKEIIAKLLNLDPRRIEQLAQKSIIPKAERGKFDLAPTVTEYVMYLQSKLRGGGENIDESEVKSLRQKAEMEERQARARIAQMKADALSGKLISREEVEREWISRCTEVRSAFMNLHVEIGFLFADSQYRSEVEEAVREFAIETLNRYSRDGICTPSEEKGGEADVGKKNNKQRRQRLAAEIEETLKDNIE